jgi:hypothetical protein
MYGGVAEESGDHSPYADLPAFTPAQLIGTQRRSISSFLPMGER